MSFNLIVDVGLVVVCLINALIITFKGLNNTVLDRIFHVSVLLALVMYVAGDYVS